MSQKKFTGLIEAFIDFCNAMESSIVNLRRQLKPLIETKLKVQIPEDRFSCLVWKDEEGARIGVYQIAADNKNDLEKWNNAYNILKINNALISTRFREDSYQYAYWIYDKMPYKIFRQVLKEEAR